MAIQRYIKVGTESEVIAAQDEACKANIMKKMLKYRLMSKLRRGTRLRYVSLPNTGKRTIKKDVCVSVHHI